MSTTTQIDMQIAGAHAELLRLQPLARQYEALKAAAKEIKAVEARIADLQNQKSKEDAQTLAYSMALITSMEVAEGVSEPAGAGLHNPVTVTITLRNGQRALRPLHALDDVERQVLCARYWELVPAWIRALGADPADAHRQYVAAKLRGYMRS